MEVIIALGANASSLASPVITHDFSSHSTLQRTIRIFPTDPPADNVMPFPQLLRKPLSSLPSRPILRNPTRRPHTLPHQYARHASSSPSSRIDTILSKLPRFLHPYTHGLRSAPVSHVVSFLILHEITAIVPLVGLAGLFHYTQWLPEAWVQGRWVREGTERFGRYFGRKGWFGFTREDSQASQAAIIGQGEGKVELDVPGLSADIIKSEGGVRVNLEAPGVGVDLPTQEKDRSVANVDQKQMLESTERKWHAGEQGTRVLVEVATAYALTKVFLPARILLSVWATPWFARVVVGRFGGWFGLGRRGGKGVRGKAGTGATGGGVGGG